MRWANERGTFICQNARAPFVLLKPEPCICSGRVRVSRSDRAIPDNAVWGLPRVCHAKLHCVVFMTTQSKPISRAYGLAFPYHGLAGSNFLSVG